MDEERLTTAASIFPSAADLSPADREVFLSEQCGDDAELREVIERLLARHDDSKGSPPDATPTQTQTEYEPAAATAEHIGPYRILEKLGEGGFGEVYAAEQSEPVKRRVALKILKAGMDTKEVLARFEAERHALAMMDHPNIARVLDAGETPQGRPYFVMELIHGEAITGYCDHHRLSVEERLNLFLPVCQAIQHAHQKGVIHRDVKPSNVLVTLVDGKPVPKVIDFGIAKATAHSLTEKTLYTVQGQVIGTPAYMSPEQAEMSGLDVDTRTDVYSLGVLLYELLTGTLPFETTKLHEAGLDAMRRIIREEEPPKPSTRISTLGEGAAEAAARRRTDPARWRKALRRELDWIIMKALEKERDRRYETVNGLAMDIGRYLADQPVMAGPPSAVYRMRKYVKRHRVTVGFTGLVAAGIVLAFALVTAQNARIAAARDEAEAVTTTLEEMLASVDPTKSGRDVTVREMLDRTAKTLGERFESQPLAEVRLRHTVARTYYALGEYESAAEHLRQVVEIRRERIGGESPALAAAMDDLARTYTKLKRSAEAEPLALEALTISRRTLGAEHPQTLHTINTLGISRGTQGRLDEAEQLYRESLEIGLRALGEEHPQTLESMGTLGLCSRRLGRPEEAEALLERALRIRQRTLGKEHPGLLLTMANLAVVYGDLGRQDEKAAMSLEALEISRRVLGEGHRTTALCRKNLASAYRQLGRQEEAAALLEEQLEATRRTYGAKHWRTAATMQDLGYLHIQRERFTAAIPLLREALAIQRRVLGDEDETTLLTMGQLAFADREVGSYEESEALLREQSETRCRLLGEEHRLTISAEHHLAWTLLGSGRLEESEELYRTGLETSRRILGEDGGQTNVIRYNLACVLARRGRRGEASAVLREAVDHGFGSRNWQELGKGILDDPDLASLHGDPAFEAIVEELRLRNEEAAGESIHGDSGS